MPAESSQVRDPTGSSTLSGGGGRGGGGSGGRWPPSILMAWPPQPYQAATRPRSRPALSELRLARATAVAVHRACQKATGAALAAGVLQQQATPASAQDPRPARFTLATATASQVGTPEAAAGRVAKGGWGGILMLLRGRVPGLGSNALCYLLGRCWRRSWRVRGLGVVVDAHAVSVVPRVSARPAVNWASTA